LLQRELFGATRDRMRREFSVFLESAAAEHPLAILLEDAHWADLATLDLIAAVARRDEPARLMMFLTYCPAAAALQPPPVQALSADLELRGCATRIELPALTGVDTAAYLAARFPDGEISERLVEMVYQQSGGNPLFTHHWLEHLVTRQLVERRE